MNLFSKCVTLKIVLLIISVNLSLSGQINNIKLINNVKSNQTSYKVNKLICGYWRVYKRTDEKHTLLELKGYEVDYFFKKDSIVSIGKDIEADKTTGTYYYDSKNREIHINYFNPIVPGKGTLPDKFIDSLVRIQIIKPIRYTVLEIHRISRNELILIEHLPHDEKEFFYNLVYYRRGGS